MCEAHFTKNKQSINCVPFVTAKLFIADEAIFRDVPSRVPKIYANYKESDSEFYVAPPRSNE